MVSAPASNADFIGFIFQGSKTGSVVSAFNRHVGLAEGSEKFDVFSIFVHLKTACSGALLSEIEIVISPQFVGFSARKSSLSGGQTAPRVQTSNQPHLFPSIV